MNSRRAECKAPLPPGCLPVGLAFNSAGNLFAAGSGNIYEFTPGGVQSTFASGLYWPYAWPLTARVICMQRISSEIIELTPDGTQRKKFQLILNT